MRLFAGLDVPYEMRRNLELLLQLVKPKADINWSNLGNIHITTKFVGEFPDDGLDGLKAALAGVTKPGDLKISIRGLGWFPNAHQPRVFYAGISAPPELARLATETDEACQVLGVPSEKRDFSPHLTLARIKRPTDLTRLKQAIADLPSTDFGTFVATHHHLFKSDLRPGGSIYTKLASWPLSHS